MWKAKYVLFDCDGVLVDSEALTQKVLSDDLAGYGLHIPPEKVGEMFVGGTMAGVMQTARRMGAKLPENWLDKINARLFAVLDAECKVVPGVPAMLDVLDQAGVSYATCSNGPMAKMEVTLTRTGLWHRFAGRIYTAHDCAAAKPAPDVYLKGASAQSIDPADCAVIEDSATGARAGGAAGMRVFGFTRETAAADLAPHCVALFDDMNALPALLGLSS